MRRISLTTDFSAEGEQAFYTALALAVRYRARLEILHVSRPGHEAGWEDFPRVRDVLERWSLLPPHSRQEDVPARLGVEIGKVEIQSGNAADGISEYVARHAPDLLVAASHGRTGLNWWFSGSVAIDALRRTAVPALLIGPAAAPIADPRSGALRLRTLLIPVAAEPSPSGVKQTLARILGKDGYAAHYVHVVESPRSYEDVRAEVPETRRLEGSVVPAILGAAERAAADLIVMPTSGGHGFMDALRGSTTQRVLHDAACPVLALPANA